MMKIKVNTNFKGIESYLFSHIANKVKEYQAKNPSANIIKLGIGDVNLPLPKLVVDAMIKASNEMGVYESFKGYPPERVYERHCRRRHFDHRLAHPHRPF